MTFTNFYGLADGKVLSSALAEIAEELYRTAEHQIGRYAYPKSRWPASPKR
jgi:hypothetical protein